MYEWIPVEPRPARPPRAQGFWRRQFDDAPTPKQLKFDVVFGLILPVLCLYFDPLVFKSWFADDGHGGFYSNYQFYAYTISALEMVALCAWLFAAGRAVKSPSLLAGVLFGGALFSFAVGLVILPFSVFGLIFLVGVLGFIPFLTSLVYLRNAWRAQSRRGAPLTMRAGVALACGFGFALLAPAAAHVSIKHEVAAALADAREARELSPERLRALRMATAIDGSAVYDELVWEYYGEPSPERRARLAKTYAEVTEGGDIKRRLAILLD